MELAGTSWKLVSFETDRDVIPVLEEAPATLEFSSDGRISGRSGCNRYFANYNLSNNQFSIEPLGATRMMCSPAQMAQETRFFQALGTAGQYVVSNEELLITYIGGRLRFTKDNR